MNMGEKEDSLTLGILEEIEKNQDVTQRHLANHLGVALGLANSYLKRCARKGYIKIQQAPANRYLYYLTPKGFTEKSRLTAAYLSTSFAFYGRAGDSLKAVFKECEERGLTRILLCSVSELSEIATLRAHELNVEICGIVDPDYGKASFLGFPVSRNLEEAGEFDVCILTALTEPRQVYESIAAQPQCKEILVPSILGFDLQNSEK